MDSTTKTPVTRTGGYAQNENPSPGGWPGKGHGVSSWGSRRREYNQNRRRLPPYGARLRKILANPACWAGLPGTSADGAHLTIWVLCGPTAWEKAHWWLNPMPPEDHDPAKPFIPAPRPLFVVSPPGEDPAEFDWTALRGHPPILVRPCGDLTRGDEAALVASLIRDGVERVLVDMTRLYLLGGCHG